MANIIDRIELSALGDKKFDLYLRSSLVCVNGFTGSGKSYLYQVLQERKDGDIAKGLSTVYSDMLLINYQTIDRLQIILEDRGFVEGKGQLIVIDNADIILPKKNNIAQRINRCWPNQYIVMTRGTSLIRPHPNSWAELYEENGVIRLRYEKWV
jgi:hypothetical protein